MSGTSEQPDPGPRPSGGEPEATESASEVPGSKREKASSAATLPAPGAEEGPRSSQVLSKRDAKDLQLSFEDAFNGVSALYRSQPHFRLYFVIALLALLLATLLQFNAAEVLFLASAILLVFLAEAFNTAVEATVDLITTEPHPLARAAKDCGAAGVFFASAYALLTGLVLFGNPAKWPEALDLLQRYLLPPVSRTGIVALLALGSAVLFALVALQPQDKVWKGRLELYGGAVFFAATAVALLSRQIPTVLLAYLIAFLATQSQVGDSARNLRHAAFGAVAGVVLSGAVFWCWPGGGL